MQTQSFTEMNQSFRDAFSQTGERAMAMNRQWMDWQLGQLKALESGLHTAMTTSFAAVEQTMNASFEMNRLVLNAFAPRKAEQKDAGNAAS